MISPDIVLSGDRPVLRQVEKAARKVSLPSTMQENEKPLKVTRRDVSVQVFCCSSHFLLVHCEGLRWKASCKWRRECFECLFYVAKSAFLFVPPICSRCFIIVVLLCILWSFRPQLISQLCDSRDKSRVSKVPRWIAGPAVFFRDVAPRPANVAASDWRSKICDLHRRSSGELFDSIFDLA